MYRPIREYPKSSNPFPPGENQLKVSLPFCIFPIKEMAEDTSLRVKPSRTAS
jgi:hypothetical protein